MNSEYQKIIDCWAKNKSLDDTVVALFRKVRDIPYGDIGSRDPLQVYKQQKGTCSGKHALLKNLYTTLGIPVKDCIVMHSFNNLRVNFPENIQEIFKYSEIIDPHNFIKIKRNNIWIAIDVTWDIGLKKIGFPINENWNGFENLEISVVKNSDAYESESVMELKQQLISDLPNEVQVARKLFLKKLTKWLEGSRI